MSNFEMKLTVVFCFKLFFHGIRFGCIFFLVYLLFSITVLHLQRKKKKYLNFFFLNFEKVKMDPIFHVFLEKVKQK